RSGASTYSTLAYLDTSNRWLFSPDAEPIVAGAKLTVGSVSNSADFELKVDPVARSVQIGTGNLSDLGLKIVGGATAGASATLGDGSNFYTMARDANDSLLHFSGTQAGVTGDALGCELDARVF